MTIAGWSKKEKPRPARTGRGFEPVVTSVSPLKESFCVRIALSKVGDAP